ncbi:hypothetical protein [Moritella sp. Urea-trap-13]|uniref:hypothetical protein n=1 Tax=Moritella sp. Urea-trap-13 TaxID=2058327 RepID=UPI000C33CC36|nr:hypothetical protein [Moritella sp. Urea-trap-13]PKH07800.1 hypothetical protein CXF93_03670 [Moritella sp. Urea-trap-13]
MGMNKTLLSLISAGVISAVCSTSVFANESQESQHDQEYHDADPRNSNFRAAVFASDAGELKLLAGGGASGLTSDISQTIGFAEYYTQSNNARVRAAHFDRFGGAYMDLYRLDEAAGMYTAGYMLPLESDDGTLFFPSLNYTYIDFKTADLSELANSSMAGSPLSVSGFSVSDADIQQTLKGNDAHLGSVNLYAVHPWNETHFSVFNVNLGSSYSGVDMQVANIMWVQGIKTHVADKTINIMLEVKYDAMKLQTEQSNLSDGEERSEEVTVSVGVDYRF